jgi:hypothetical protein
VEGSVVLVRGRADPLGRGPGFALRPEPGPHGEVGIGVAAGVDVTGAQSGCEDLARGGALQLDEGRVQINML